MASLIYYTSICTRFLNYYLYVPRKNVLSQHEGYTVEIYPISYTIALTSRNERLSKLVALLKRFLNSSSRISKCIFKVFTDLQTGVYVSKIWERDRREISFSTFDFTFAYLSTITRSRAPFPIEFYMARLDCRTTSVKLVLIDVSLGPRLLLTPRGRNGIDHLCEMFSPRLTRRT